MSSVSHSVLFLSVSQVYSQSSQRGNKYILLVLRFLLSSILSFLFLNLTLFFSFPHFFSLLFFLFNNSADKTLSEEIHTYK